jgi:PGDYG protein
MVAKEFREMVLKIDNPDLVVDPGAQRAIKDETVWVEFADAGGELTSGVGINRYVPGDALITGSTGDRWSVSRDRFDAKYEPEPSTVRGQPGKYRNRPVSVLAKCIDQAFSVTRTAGGDSLHGGAGDWLIQYAPGDYGIVERTRFERVYRLIGDDSHATTRGRGAMRS